MKILIFLTKIFPNLFCYIVREAESIIEKYLTNRELGNIKKYYQLKEKYEKLKILSFLIFAIFIISMILKMFF